MEMECVELLLVSKIDLRIRWFIFPSSMNNRSQRECHELFFLAMGMCGPIVRQHVAKQGPLLDCVIQGLVTACPEIFCPSLRTPYGHLATN
jgi:hypothetical protein